MAWLVCAGVMLVTSPAGSYPEDMEHLHACICQLQVCGSGLYFAKGCVYISFDSLTAGKH
jgi:hypothetical protein